MKREISKSSQSPVSQSAPGPVSCGAGQQVKIFLDTLIPHQDIGSSANVQVMCCAVVVSTFLPDQRPVPSLSQVLCVVFSARHPWHGNTATTRSDSRLTTKVKSWNFNQATIFLILIFRSSVRPSAAACWRHGTAGHRHGQYRSRIWRGDC